MHVGFVGLSHLSVVYGAVAAEKGCSVTIFDPDEFVVRSASEGVFDFYEPGVSESVSINRNSICFDNSVKALEHCELIFLAKDVATDSRDYSQIHEIELLLELVEASCVGSYSLIVLCQIPPGFSRKIAERFDSVVYMVETLVFGQALERARDPDRIILGVDDGISIPQVVHQFVAYFQCPVLPMCYESAELTKIAINLFLASSITTTNLLAQVGNVVGANWSDIRGALQLDKRIGEHAYLLPGLGIGGGNLRRDIRTVERLACEHGLSTALTDTFLDLSAQQLCLLDSVLLDWFDRAQVSRAVIGVLGLAYKTGTRSVKNSPGVYIAKMAEKLGDLVVMDPVVPLQEWGSLSRYKVDELEDLLSEAQILIIATPYPQYLDKIRIRIEDSKLAFIIDPYGLLLSCVDELKCEYFSLMSGFRSVK